jgi:hypothetical protein
MFIAGVVLAYLGTGEARGDIHDWEVNEVLVSAGGDASVRFVELANPVGGCLFPSSRVVVYDGAGGVLGSVTMVTQTTCYGPDTYYLLATSAAVAAYGVAADKTMAPVLPAGAAQVCFVSSTSRYDCVRWGSLATPLADFFGPGDTSVATSPPDSQALARTGRTHVVMDDWQILSPTPRGPNDGSPWSPPDAGPTPDAGPPPDAGPDAGPRPDAAMLPDARPTADASPQRYLDVDPGGGATCSCRGGADGGGSALLILGALWLAITRRRGRAMLSAMGWGSSRATPRC